MTDHHDLSTENPELIKEMLLGSGYAEKAIDYYLAAAAQARPAAGPLAAGRAGRAGSGTYSPAAAWGHDGGAAAGERRPIPHPPASTGPPPAPA